MKKRVGLLINATGGSSWIGGLYYKRNIIYSLLQNEYIKKKYRLIVVSEEDNREVFATFSESIEFVSVKHSSKRKIQFKLLLVALKLHCKLIFPGNGRLFTLFGITPIHWIADFQHNRLPNMFSDEEKRNRTETYFGYSRDRVPLILSSLDSLNDFREFYGSFTCKTYVVPFVSYIEDMIRQLSITTENDILEKYGLEGKRYVCIMNQFWQHKNHIVVLNAMKTYFFNNPKSDLIFTFTGKLDDYRSPEYINKLKELFAEDYIKEHTLLLGFIDRMEQIAIMKNSQFIIQPSLFEGWGTVVEDAKVLDKTILLSDIPIHREQRSNKCELFNPRDQKALAKLIESESNKGHRDDVEFGIMNMLERAKEYSKGFEKLLKEQEVKRI